MACNVGDDRHPQFGWALLIRKLRPAIPVIAWVANETANPERLAIFKQGLTELGIDGKNIKIEYRRAKLDGEYAPIMDELVALKVSIIVVSDALRRLLHVIRRELFPL